ncbi:MAG TPA: polysaccharide deacetylase family protein [Steroidobacteraceae bacterium]|nr:polysaccharide deacetylase family protein [Steroidobacteraceae bacterium]
MAAKDHPRDLIGYGAQPPSPRWPQSARIAVQFVLNYQEGGEPGRLHGDDGAHNDLQLQSVHEYGSRAGVWRVLRLAQEFGIPLTVFAVATALERHPILARELVGLGHEIASHGWRWIDYQKVPEARERADMRRAIEALTRVTGSRPLGWYTGRPSRNTRRLVVEEGGFLYDADACNDDLPYWVREADRSHLVVPYNLDVNDIQSGEQFFTYAGDAFEALYAEGAVAPKMMSIGLHSRLIGQPGRIGALRRLFAHLRDQRDVWFCRRIDIARHWIEHHPPT